MTFNSGDVILFSTGNGFKSNVGTVLRRKDNGDYIVLSNWKCVYKNIKPEWIESIENVQDVRNYIISQYSDRLSEKQGLIRKVTQEEKDKDKETQYRELQKEIKTVAKRLYESTDDIDFENRLKAISDLKKSIFSIELECVSDIRKYNGKIKYEIREIENQLKSELNKISDENITKTFEFE